MKTNNGSEEDTQRPQTRDIWAAMPDAALVSASQTRRAQVLLTCSVVMQASASRGSRKADKELDNWRVLSGKRHRCSPNVYEAGPSCLVKRKLRCIKLKGSQFEPDW